jgi:hypothetical protein
VPDKAGTAHVELTVEDAGDDNDFATTSDNAMQKLTLTVTVNPVNDAPSLDPPADVLLDEDGQLGFTLTGISAGLGETQPLRVTATSSNPSVVPNPTITYSSPDDSAELSVTPISNAFGSVVVTVVVEDGGVDNDLATLNDNSLVTQTFTVTVLPVNDAPAVDTPNDIVVNWNSQQQSLGLSGIGSGPSEIDAIRLSATSRNPDIISSTKIEYVAGDTQAILRFTPIANQFGAVEIEVEVEDGGLDGDFATTNDNGLTIISFEVLVNAVPIAQSDRVRTVRQTSLDANVLANDADANGSIDDLEVIIVKAPPATEGTISIQPNGQVRFVPAAGFVGVSRFTYAAQDQFGAQSEPTEVLVGVGRTRLQNPFENLDVNRNGIIAASDALLVINLLNDASDVRLVDELPADSFDLDVNGDGRITAGDALLVINFLNAQSSGGEGESQSLQPAHVTPPRLNDRFFANYEELEVNDRKLKSRGFRP